VSEREREGEAGPCGTDGPKEGAGPCGEHRPHAGEGKEKGRRVLFGLEEGTWAARERNEKEGKRRGVPAGGWATRAAAEREREEWVGGFVFFSNTFSNFQKFKLFQNFSTFKLFSKIFKSI
jgi:hypothetical protein